MQATLRTSPAQVRKALAQHEGPVAALAALQPLGAALLEGRGVHPENRSAYVPFGPVATLWAEGDAAFLKRGSQPHKRLQGDPWHAVTQELGRVRVDGPRDPPFQGGWVGFLAHEAAGHVLSTPAAAPSMPARPRLPWAHFRFYPDVVVFEGDRATIIVNDFGDEEVPARDRVALAEKHLHKAATPTVAARAADACEPTLDAAGFMRRVDALQALVRGGDCFQVNLTASLAFPWAATPTTSSLIALYDRYAASNPGAWGGFYEAPGATVLSSSPECLVDVREGTVRLRPIAGTRPRSGMSDADEARARELQTDPKERAEHAMLVDLARNDAARICRPGTVHVPNLAGVESYRHVMHLVSEIQGEARADLTITRLLEAVFPGGTVTGAPKRRAVQRIAELEPGPRGPYTGALGYVSLTGATQWNLLIRTLVATPSHLVAHAGCGIVEGSRAALEYEELMAKARAQVDAALGRATPAPVECGVVRPGPAWRPDPGARVSGRRVLLVDHEDSFVHNLADYCERLGAATHVVSAHRPAKAAWARAPTHVVLSPGPGRPADFPTTLDHIERAERAGVPVLGVCLGHQALAERQGAQIERHPETVHGRATPVELTRAGQKDVLLESWKVLTVGRYHSLVARDLPPTVEPLARLADGTCMAFRVKGRPQWGLQFHPESILTQDGMRLVRNFLEVDRGV